MQKNNDDNFSVLKHYMIEVDLPESPPVEYFQLIPEQRDYVVKMMEKGVILSYGLSSDRDKLWVVALAGSEFEAGKLMEDFPMFKYMTFNIRQLMFYNNTKHKMPELSLN